MTGCEGAAWDVFELHARSYAGHLNAEDGVAITVDRCVECDKVWPCPTYLAIHLVAEVRRLRDVETLAREALAELDAQPELAHPDAVWYTGAALRDALEADRG